MKMMGFRAGAGLLAMAVFLPQACMAFLASGLQVPFTRGVLHRCAGRGASEGPAVAGQSLLAGGVFGTSVAPATAHPYRRSRRLQLTLRSKQDDEEESEETAMEADEGISMMNPVEQEFMDGWNAVIYSELRRRAAVVGEEEGKLPTEALQPREVIATVMDALLNNDDPFPDHGCALAIRFSSARNPVGHWEGRMLGEMLRKTDYAMVISDGHKYEWLGDMHFESNDKGDFAVQDILVEGIHDSYLALRWQLSRCPSTQAWLTDTVAIIRPGPI